MTELDLDKVLGSLPTGTFITYANFLPMGSAVVPEVTVVLTFVEKGFGFGEVSLRQTGEGVFLDTEQMSLERVKSYFNALLDSAILDTDMTPDRHRLFNQVMGRQCGDSCPVCNDAGRDAR